MAIVLVLLGMMLWIGGDGLNSFAKALADEVRHTDSATLREAHYLLVAAILMQLGALGIVGYGLLH